MNKESRMTATEAKKRIKELERDTKNLRKQVEQLLAGSTWWPAPTDPPAIPWKTPRPWPQYDGPTWIGPYDDNTTGDPLPPSDYVICGAGN